MCQNKAVVSLRKTLIWGALKYYQHYPSNYRTSCYCTVSDCVAVELSGHMNLPYYLFCLVFTPYRTSCPSTLHRTSLHRYLESHRTLPWVCRKCRQELIWKRMQRNLSMSWTWLPIHVVTAKVHFRVCTWGRQSQGKSGKKAVSFGKKIKVYWSVNIQVQANSSSVVCTYPPVNLFLVFFVGLLVIVALPAVSWFITSTWKSLAIRAIWLAVSGVIYS